MVDTSVTNADIASVLREMAELLEITGANPYRIRAYATAARTVEELSDSVAHIVATDATELEELPGIGRDLAGKISEITHTGTLRALSELRHRSPRGASELMRVPGLGPKRVHALAERLGVRSVAGLARAARAHRVRRLKGFGAKTEERILYEIMQGGADAHRMLRFTAADHAGPLVAYLQTVPGVTQVEIAGSFRRARETVGDLDILVATGAPARAVNAFIAYPGVTHVLARGRTRASVRLRSGLQVDLRVLAGESFGAGLYYFTGSKAHNIAVRQLARERGRKINEYGVFRGTRRVSGRTEQDVFDAVQLPWIPPELREARGEIEAARAGTLPRLVELTDIRGDLQVHTTDSDGRNTLDEMAEAAEALGYEYLAITDHTPTVRIAGGLDRAGFLAQMQRIDRLNARLRTLTVLKGAEVDIHADGSLDLDDRTLAALDIVLIALHTRFDLPAEEQTARVVRALRHPSVDIFAHPTGRVLNGRRGATFEFDEICRVAADEGKMLEVDAQPQRLDLDDVHVRAAIARGITLSIGSDAHAVAELKFMRWGVDQARRGWASKADVLNTKPINALVKMLHSGR